MHSAKQSAWCPSGARCAHPMPAPLQMVLQRSSSYVVALANFSLGEPAPVQHAVGLQGHSLLFAAGTKVSQAAGQDVGLQSPPAQPRSVSPGVACECHRPWLPPLLNL